MATQVLNQGPVMESEVLFEDNQCELHFIPNWRNASEATLGKLSVRKDVLLWSQGTEFITIHYTNIILHAICRQDAVIGGRGAIYCQLASARVVDSMGISLNLADLDGEELAMELRLVPSNELCLDEFFQAFCEASSLHQDEQEEMLLGGNEMGAGWITSENVDSFQPNSQQSAEMSRLESLFVDSAATPNSNGKRTLMVDGQFDDAPEEQEQR